MNIIIPAWKEAIAQGLPNSALTGDLRVLLFDASLYTFFDFHTYLSDMGNCANLVNSGSLAGKTYAGGLLTASANTVIAAPTVGTTFSAMALFINTGVATTSRLVAILDASISGLPTTSLGSAITVVWNPLGIMNL